MVNEVFMEEVGNDSGCSKNSRNWSAKYGKVLKYEDYTEGSGTTSQRTSRYFKGQWKPITQKFITEYTDNGIKVKVILSKHLYELYRKYES